MKYEFVFYCDKERAIEEVLRYTEKPVLLFEQEVIYGKRLGSFVKLYHGTVNRNSFRPIFVMHFKETELGTTMAKGVFLCHWSTILFSIVWVSVVCSMWFQMGNAPMFVRFIPIIFLLFFAGLVTFGAYLARNDKKNIIGHIKMHQRIINGEENF